MLAEDFIFFKYDNSEEEAERRIALLDLIMEELGAEPYDIKENRRLWKYNGRFYYSDIENTGSRVRLIIKSAEKHDGEFTIKESTDYDNLVCELYYIVQRAFGQIPSCENTFVVDEFQMLLTESENYAVINEYEYAFLCNKSDRQCTELGFFYGDPYSAIIDREERCCIVAGDNIRIYDMTGREIKSFDCQHEWVYYMKQEEDIIKIRIENSETIEFSLNDILKAAKGRY